MSALDELLSPNNFPPCDPMRGDAVRELQALRASHARLAAALRPFVARFRAMSALTEREFGLERPTWDEAKAALREAERHD